MHDSMDFDEKFHVGTRCGWHREIVGEERQESDKGTQAKGQVHRPKNEAGILSTIQLTPFHTSSYACCTGITYV